MNRESIGFNNVAAGITPNPARAVTASALTAAGCHDASLFLRMQSNVADIQAVSDRIITRIVELMTIRIEPFTRCGSDNVPASAGQTRVARNRGLPDEQENTKNTPPR